ncbi:UNVERIFIED_CONTAM: hypothetical protein K2H54_012330 [Gekko kuhli]
MTVSNPSGEISTRISKRLNLFLVLNPHVPPPQPLPPCICTNVKKARGERGLENISSETTPDTNSALLKSVFLNHAITPPLLFKKKRRYLLLTDVFLKRLASSPEHFSF